MEESKLIWEEYIQQFIKNNTREISKYRLSLGILTNIIENYTLTQKKYPQSEIKDYFSIITIEDAADGNAPKALKGSLGQNYTEGSIISLLRQKSTEEYYRLITSIEHLDLRNIVPCIQRHTEFLRSLKLLSKNWSKKSQRTIEVLIMRAGAFEKQCMLDTHMADILSNSATANTWNHMVNDTCYKVIVPGLLRHELVIKEDNLLNYNNNEVYILEIVEMIKEKNGIKNILETLGIDDSADYYSVFL